tara:strand:- start:9403 stop:9807 length:405 start_codon:yes stop_codon:yes gene_type:complete
MAKAQKKFAKKYVQGSSNPARRKALMSKIAKIYDKYRGGKDKKPFPADVQKQLKNLMKERDSMEYGGKVKKYKKGGMAGLDAAEKEVYRRGLAAYMSSGNRPKTSQHAWAMGRVNSAFGKKEAAKIRAGKSKKK